MVHHRCGYFSCWPIFFPFTTPYPPPHPLTALKTKISKKWRKKNTWTNHHFTQVCQNHEHMLYCSWDMVRDRCNCYFWFHAIFCSFYPHNSPKNENFKKMKKTRWKKKKCLEKSSFYTSVPKIMIICYTVSEIWHMTDVILTFHFVLFFAFLPHKSPKNGNF